MRWLVAGMLLGTLTVGVPRAAASGPDPGCATTVTWQDTDSTCTSSPTSTPGTSTTGSGPDYEYRPSCLGETTEAGCTRFVDCVRPDGSQGRVYEAVLAGEVDHYVCLGASAPGVVTPGRVVRAFRALAWPASRLVVQPPGGRTLVNFETNFYTEDTEPVRQRVRLLGQRIVIEAEPVEFVWVHGDGTRARTADPGAAYPDLRVTHEYVHVEKVRVRLDTVYAGRYRIGGGSWVTLPATLTVRGESQGLEIIEATPTLTSIG